MFVLIKIYKKKATMSLFLEYSKAKHFFVISLLNFISYGLKLLQQTIKINMSKPQSPRKNNSTLSTVHNTNYQSLRTTNYHNDGRPKTANLVYANKPYKKQCVYWNQSSSTWRHSTRKHSFSKDQRFRTVLPYSLDIIEPEICTPISAKATTMGKGRRVPISETVLRNAKQKPSPDSYSMNFVDEITRSPSKGRSFSSNWQKHQKRYLSYRKDVYSSHFVNDNPSAKYQVREQIGKGKRAFTAYGRQKMFTEKMADSMRDVPGPHYKLNDRHLYMTVGFQNCSFTDGDRLDLSAPANDFPGSQYIIPGFSDKYKLTRRKNCPD